MRDVGKALAWCSKPTAIWDRTGPAKRSALYRFLVRIRHVKKSQTKNRSRNNALSLVRNILHTDGVTSSILVAPTIPPGGFHQSFHFFPPPIPRGQASMAVPR